MTSTTFILKLWKKSYQPLLIVSALFETSEMSRLLL